MRIPNISTVGILITTYVRNLPNERSSVKYFLSSLVDGYVEK